MTLRLLPIFILILFSCNMWGQDNNFKLEDNKTLLKSIFFGGGSSYIDEEQAQELADFINAVENVNRYEILVHSFTDNIGSLEFNQRLSRHRSEAVIEELEKLYISIDVLLKADFGEQNPIYSNRTFEGKLMNRRVDVILRPLSF